MGGSGLLALDIGNTNIKAGLRRDGRWAFTWRARTVSDRLTDEYAVLLHDFLLGVGLSYHDVTAVIMSSVVPGLTPIFTELAHRYMQLDPLIVSPQMDTGLQIALDQPQQVGSDRLVNVVAAANLYGGPAVIIDLGTATKFEALSRENIYLGGAIAPGMNIALDALLRRADRLSRITIVPPPSPIGTNTTHALQSGIFWGYVSMVENMVARLRLAMHEPDARVVATGGLASIINRHVPLIDVIAPYLTLDGLSILYDRCTGFCDK